MLILPAESFAQSPSQGVELGIELQVSVPELRFLAAAPACFSLWHVSESDGGPVKSQASGPQPQSL